MTPQLFIGMLSGTSLDAIDCALVKFVDNKPEVVDFTCSEIPANLKHDVNTLIANRGIDLRLLGKTDVLLGQLFADSAKAILRKNNLPAGAVAAIGCHGQTIWHEPAAGAGRFTMQIGDPNTIAHLTDIATVSDFRRRDMAAGGQGAPLVPALHQALFRSPDVPRAVLNLGGIANITVLPPAPAPCFGYDTGPANILLDSWIQHTRSLSYDEEGAWAQTGKIQHDLLNAMLAEPYLAMSAPKSTGRELFNLAWLMDKLVAMNASYKDVDIQATLLEFTAETICREIRRHLHGGEVLACGGGVRNTVLMNRLQNKLTAFKVVSTEEHGLHPDCVEAVAFAWFAKQTIEGKVVDFSPFTGASKAVITGGVYRV